MSQRALRAATAQEQLARSKQRHIELDMAWNRLRRHLTRTFDRNIGDPLKFQLGEIACLSQQSVSNQFHHLWDSEFSVFSQWGEDGILNYLCDCLGLDRPRILEIGAGDFRESNSRFAAQRRSAMVMAVDARNDLAESIQGLQVNWQTTILPVEKWITPDSAAELFKLAQDALGSIDVFSIDIDGMDYWVLQQTNLDEVQIVVVEYNPLFGPKSPVSVPKAEQFNRFQAHFSGVYFGASIRSYIQLLSARNFIFVGTNRVCNNAFFVRDTSYELIGLPSIALDDLSIYTDWRVREGRSRDGSLTYATAVENLNLIGHLPLVDTVTGAISTVAQATHAN